MFVLRALVMLLHAEPDFRSASARKKAKQGVAEGRQSRQERGERREGGGRGVAAVARVLATALAVFLFVCQQILNLFYCSLVLVAS